MKRLLYFTLATIFAALASSCSDKDVYSPVEFDAQLAPSNTYRVGEPTKFNISGNAQFITFWSGEGQHEYRYKERNSVALEDIETCKLELNMVGNYGEPGGFKVFVSKTALGLKGNDAVADKATTDALVASSFAGWEEVTFTDPKNGTAPVKVAEIDLKNYAGNFVFMIWCKPTLSPTSAQRTYYASPVIVSKFRGIPEQRMKITDLALTTFSPTPQRESNPYEVKTTKTDAYVSYAGDPQITITGIKAKQEQLEHFICSAPASLNIVIPDKGSNIKGYVDVVQSHSHTYEKPGKYDVTFVGKTGNYAGESTKIQHLTVNIIEPIK